MPPTLDKPLQLAPTTNLAAGSTEKNNQNLAGLGNNNIANNTPPIEDSFFDWNLLQTSQDGKLLLFWIASNNTYISVTIAAEEIYYDYLQSDCSAEEVLKMNTWQCFTPKDAPEEFAPAEANLTDAEKIAKIAKLHETQNKAERDNLRGNFLPKVTVSEIGGNPIATEPTITTDTPNSENELGFTDIFGIIVELHKLKTELTNEAYDEIAKALTEDYKIIITGTNWEGEQCSRLLSLALEIMPWSAAANKFRKLSKAVIKFSKRAGKRIGDFILSSADELIDNFHRYDDFELVPVGYHLPPYALDDASKHLELRPFEQSPIQKFSKNITPNNSNNQLKGGQSNNNVNKNSQISPLTTAQTAQEVKNCIANSQIATKHIEEHFHPGPNLTRARGTGETFVEGINKENLLPEINSLLDNPSNIISTSISPKGHYELILDMGRPINLSGSTNYIRIWIEPATGANPAKISSIHPKT